jgi:hypothetical protein
LLRDLLNKCFYPDSWNDGQERIVGTYCVVEKADFQRAQAELPELALRSPESICADCVVRVVLGLLPQDPEKPLNNRMGTAELYFDQGEPFTAIVKGKVSAAVLRSPEERGPLCMISHVGEVSTQECPAMQAADFMAWHVNRWFSKQCANFNLMAVFSAQGVGEHFDYERLCEWYGHPIDDIRGL